MGNIKKVRKKYSKPPHPWRAARITEENKIISEYGIPRKTELWKATSKLESIKNQAKKLTTQSTVQASKELQALLKKLQSYNLVSEEGSYDSILGITLKDMLDRRLQTFIYKKGYAKSMRQARQMIAHRHILIGNKLVTSPSYLVKVSQEGSVSISPKSPFYSQDHPERLKEPSKRKSKVKNEQR